MESVTIIGPGRVGGALAIALNRAGYRIDDLILRDQSRVSRLIEFIDPIPRLTLHGQVTEILSDIILITTSDNAIAEVAHAVSSIVPHSSIVLHISGSLSSDELSVFRPYGVPIGSMHPLVAISDAQTGSKLFSGAYFCLEGDPAAVKVSGEIVKRLGGNQFTVETSSKTLYHAAAVMAAGHLISLIDMSVGLLVDCGFDRQTARKVLLPLIESSVINLQKQDTPKALTGPFARAELSTVERHLRSFDRQGLSSEKSVYLELGLRALGLAEKNGADKAKLDDIRKCIIMAKLMAK